MNSYACVRQDGYRRDRNASLGDGGGDNDDQSGDKRESLISTVTESRHSERNTRSPPSHRDLALDTDTARTGLPSPPSMKRKKDRWEQIRAGACFDILLLVVTIILLLSTITAILVIIEKSNSNSSDTLMFRENVDSFSTTQRWFQTQIRTDDAAESDIMARVRGTDKTKIFRNTFDDRNSSSYSLAHHRFRSRRKRFLQEENEIKNSENETNKEKIDKNEEEPEQPTDINFVNETDFEIEKIPAIEIVVPPGGNESSIFQLINEFDESVNTKTEGDFASISVPTSTPSRSPSLEPTAVPSNLPTISSVPSPSPSETFSPSIQPTMSPKPTISPNPTVKPSPSPSSPPSFSSFPSGSPSDTPTIRPSLSHQPTVSPSVSASPSTSFSPTESLQPSSSPILSITELGIVMKLKNLPAELQSEEIERWQTVTSEHIENYYKKVSKLYPDFWSIEIMDVNTTFISQDPIGKHENDAILFLSSAENQPNDETPISNLGFELTYDQTVTYKSDEVDMTRDVLHDRLFVLPFRTDSFDYANDLVKAMNWSNWVIVDQIEEGIREEPPQDPQQKSALTIYQTLTISASIIFSACLIVLFLLLERTKRGCWSYKGNASAVVDDQKEESSSISDSRTKERQENPSQISSETRLRMEWEHQYYNNIGVNNSTGDSQSMVLSIHSAPSHLRKNLVERARRDSNDNTSLNGKGALGKERSNHSKSSSRDSNADLNYDYSPKPFKMEENYGSPKILPPEIPKQVPISIRSSSDRSALTSRSTSNRPFLPPLPPPQIERHRSSEFENESETVPVSEGDSNSQRSFARATAFRRPSGRHGRRVSNLSEASMMTELTFTTEPYLSDRSDRAYFNTGDDLGISDPNLKDTNFPAIQSPPDAYAASQQLPNSFTSPLHIPDQEGMDTSATNLRRTSESPINSLSTMLGLESRPIDNSLAPARTGFAIKVEDIEDIEK